MLSLARKSFARLGELNGVPDARPRWVVQATYGDVDRKLNRYPKTDPARDATPVIVAQGMGDFDGRAEKLPPGSMPTPGRYLTVVMLASDGTITQWMLGNDQPDLSALGAVMTLAD